MTHPFHDRLTPEERDLAARLARVGPHGEPPAALDARILAAAHAAVATAPRARRRWPAALGVAATLAIAVGITWQLRPHDDTAPALQEGPVMSAPANAMEDAAAAAEAASPEPSPVGASAGTAPTAESESAPAPTPAQTRETQRRSSVSQPPKPVTAFGAAAPRPTPPPPDARPESDEPLPLQPPAEAAAPTRVMAPPPPAPPAPPPPVAAPAPAATPQSAPVPTMSRKAMAQPVAADMAAEAAQPRINGRAVRDVPIELDARLAAADWLDRIRLRQIADDLDGARASLALFRRYYPDHAIPEDLAPLAR